MLKALVGSIVFLPLGFIILLNALPDIVPLSEDIRTQDATDTGLFCSTGAGETECEITLSSVHQYDDTTEMTVTETSPGSGDRTGDTTVGDDRKTLTISNLSESTSYIFDVDYKEKAEEVSRQLNGVLRLLPMLLVLGLVVVAIAAAAAGWARLAR